MGGGLVGSPRQARIFSMAVGEFPPMFSDKKFEDHARTVREPIERDRDSPQRIQREPMAQDTHISLHPLPSC
jgi:hypothetical protein